MSDTSVPAGRSCGTGSDACTACCYTHGVTEIKKPKFFTCHDCDTGNGCRIYERRPIACKEFSCLWLSGSIGLDSERPDKVGVVSIHVSARYVPRDVPLVALFESEPGALAREPAQAFLARLLDGGALVSTRAPYTIPDQVFHVPRGSLVEPYGIQLERDGYQVVWHEKK